MSDNVKEKWEKLISRIDKIFKQNQDKTIRLPCSFGVKSLIVLFATLRVSDNFEILHISSGRHSENVSSHISNVIEMLRNRNITVNIERIHCDVTSGDYAMHTKPCPVINYLLLHLPHDTVDIFGSTNKVYKSYKKNNIKAEFRSHADRHFPIQHYTLDMLSEMYFRNVPVEYRFPTSSICTCNSPVCPSIYDEYPPHIFKKHTDWTIYK